MRPIPGFYTKEIYTFIYSDISDRVKLAAEIEFEYGGVGGGASRRGDLGIWYYRFFVDRLDQLEGWTASTPLGKLNLVHDSPLQDFTDRPLVDQLSSFYAD